MQSQYKRRLHGATISRWHILLALLLDEINQGGRPHMKYINATEIVPVRLVEELQKYMQAGYLYISAKKTA